LRFLMLLAATAWRLRENARRALREDDAHRAVQLAAQAQEICFTPAGRRLEFWAILATCTKMSAEEKRH
jgi:hypothetical protein